MPKKVHDTIAVTHVRMHIMNNQYDSEADEGGLRPTIRRVLAETNLQFSAQWPTIPARNRVADALCSSTHPGLLKPITE